MLHLALTALLAFPLIQSETDEPAPYLRLAEEGSQLDLELALRSFQRLNAEGQPTGPKVLFVSAVHLGEAGYYERVQQRLDACDVVLFERVDPRPLANDLAGIDSPKDLSSVRATRRRMRVVAIALAQYQEAHQAYPAELDQLLEESAEGMPSARLRRALKDAWEHDLVYEIQRVADQPTNFKLSSRGSDGKSGGAGAARDLSFADQREVDAAEIAGKMGVQQDLAEALGLVFQLEGMDYLGAHWRNSDMDIETLSAALNTDQLGESDILEALGGQDKLTQIMTGAIKLIGKTRIGNGMMRLIMVEALPRANELMSKAPGPLAKVMDVLLDQRNAIVLADLERVLEREDVSTIAVFYGAAHMLGLERHLSQELDLHPVGEEWLPAIHVDLDSMGLSKLQIKLMRSLLRKSLDMQLPK